MASYLAFSVPQGRVEKEERMCTMTERVQPPTAYTPPTV